MLIQTITAIRNKGMGDGTSVSLLLKQVYGKLDDLMCVKITAHIS